MEKEKIWSVRFALESPFYVATDGSPLLGFDASIASTAKGEALIPGTLVTGILSDALHSIAATMDGALPGLSKDRAQEFLSAVFGSASGTASRNQKAPSDISLADNAPNRSACSFSDFISFEKIPLGRKTSSLSRIKMNESMGTVQRGALQTLPLPWPIGKKIEFRGDVALFPGTVDASLFEKMMRLASQTITSLGGYKSAGFGRLAQPISFEVAAVTTGQPVQLQALEKDGFRRYDFRFTADRPVLVGGKSLAPNIFRGSPIIPGGALKGALASSMDQKDLTKVSTVLSSAIFSHAVPETGEEGNDAVLALPLSIFKTKVGNQEKFQDLLGSTEGGDKLYPLSQSDWKEADFDAGQNTFPNINFFQERVFEIESRTRTAIDYDSGTAAYDENSAAGKLFAYQAIKHETHDSLKITWNASISFPASCDRQEEALIVEALSSVKPRLGKTDARLEILPPNPPSKTTDQKLFYEAGDEFFSAISLETDAALLDPSEYADESKSLHELYGIALQKSFECKIELHDYFVNERLAGAYQAWRYRPLENHMSPWVISEAGSVFLVSCSSAEKDSFENGLRSLLSAGLKIGFGKHSWQTCPFVPENGYGAVAINLTWKPENPGGAR